MKLNEVLELSNRLDEAKISQALKSIESLLDLAKSNKKQPREIVATFNTYFGETGAGFVLDPKKEPISSGDFGKLVSNLQQLGDYFKNNKDKMAEGEAPAEYEKALSNYNKLKEHLKEMKGKLNLVDTSTQRVTQRAL